MLATAMTAALALTVPADGNSDQWLARDVSGEGPIASFLSWNYSNVITRAHCANGQVTLQYFYTFPEAPSPAEAPLALLIDGASHRLAPSVDDMDRQVYTLSSQGKAALRRARNVDLDAPNEADEPWYLGQAAALVDLAKRCG
ncbi:hypothetical protein [Brevundimonas faecalis]|uniref:Alpha/beta hydrolase n=1 Tax=Brevundimonas faecalis TaxID=947378 RepID=A0ABV2RDV8_9CAUL